MRTLTTILIAVIFGALIIPVAQPTPDRVIYFDIPTTLTAEATKIQAQLYDFTTTPNPPDNVLFIPRFDGRPVAALQPAGSTTPQVIILPYGSGDWIAVTATPTTDFATNTPAAPESTPLPTYTPRPTYTLAPTYTIPPTWTQPPTLPPSATPSATATAWAEIRQGSEWYWLFIQPQR